MFASAQAMADVPVKEIFSAPLVTGASVSADYGTLSPGKRLALRYTSKDKVKTVAQGGRPGRETIQLLSEDSFKDRSAVIAIDFFFWDSVMPGESASLAALKKLVDQAKKNNLTLILGEIPELLPGRQPGRVRLNAEIEKACRNYSKCHLMPFDSLLKQVLRDRALTIKGRKYQLRELVPDGLHLSELAADYLADLMLEVIQKRS